MSWTSYPKILNVGHRRARAVLCDPVVVEEKVDGSQFSFGVFDGELRARSKRKPQLPQTDEMFHLAIENIRQLAPRLHNGWTYSAEYLRKPKHNTITYARTPKHNLILFDVRTGEEDYLPYAAKAAEASVLGLECVARLYEGPVDLKLLQRLLETPSALGGSKIEGVVLKPITPKVDPDGKALMAKYVSEIFKEKSKRPRLARKDMLGGLCEAYRSEARWTKMAQRLRDHSELECAPQDIPKIIAAVQADILDEEADEIRAALFDWAWPQIRRKSVAGLAEWYKQRLLEEAFE